MSMTYEELDRAYAEADAFDAKKREQWIKDHPDADIDEDEDELALLQKAGLNHRGQP